MFKLDFTEQRKDTLSIKLDYKRPSVEFYGVCKILVVEFVDAFGYGAYLLR